MRLPIFLCGSMLMLAPACGASQAFAQSAGPIGPAAVDNVLDDSKASIEGLYRDLHQHPELGFAEVRTAKLLADRMRKLGFTVTENVGKTGVVAVYRNGAGPVALVRTEMDALPMEEKTGLPFASKAVVEKDGKSTFVAHSCGHDVHMAWWVATAQALLALKDKWHGTLLFVAQPSEETLSGAKAMLDDGLLKRFPRPDYAIAAHVGGGMPLGTVLVNDGVILSASDAVDITFKGRGAHGSAPSAAIDPIVMGANFVTDVQSVISRRKDAGAFGVITVGAFQSGTVGNIIPDTATLRLSLRSFTPEVRALLLDGVEKTAKGVAMIAGAPPPSIVRPYGTAETRNDSSLVARLTPPLKSVFGEGVVSMPASAPGFSGSEDFSVFAAAGIPSIYLMIGGDDPTVLNGYKEKGIAPPTNHSPNYAPSARQAIRNGAAALVTAILAQNGGN